MNATMTQPPTAMNVLEAALWAALNKVASKEGDRDELVAGGKHAVDLELSGKVDDQPVHYDVQAVLTVGHDQQKASSVTPDPALLLANVLAKLNHTTREKILRELPEQFAESDGRLPAVGSDLLAATNEMLKQLRAKRRSRPAARFDANIGYRNRTDQPRCRSHRWELFPQREKRRALVEVSRWAFRRVKRLGKAASMDRVSESLHQ